MIGAAPHAVDTGGAADDVDGHSPLGGCSALAFGAAHASNAPFGVAPSFVAIQVVAATALGLILAHIRLRTGSLLASMVLHSLVNGIDLLA